MDTQPQSNRECGPLMTMYMVEFGEALTKLGNKFSFGALKMEMDQFIVHEEHIAKAVEHSLASTTRQAIHEVLENKQIEIKSIA